MDFKDPENKDDLQKAIHTLLNNYSDMLIEMTNKEGSDYKKAALLYYWLRDYRNYVKNEANFKSKYTPPFKRGNIVNINFGFNLGSELGGLHYAIVISDSKPSNPMLIVAPMTSFKPGHKSNRHEIFIDNQLFFQLKGKQDALTQALKHQLNVFYESKNMEEVNNIFPTLEQLQKIKQQIQKLKNGSIINISQIRAISKMRIIDPQSTVDVFYNVSVSSDILNQIDDKIALLLTKPKRM